MDSRELLTKIAAQVAIGVSKGDPDFVDPWADVCAAFNRNDLEAMLGVLPRAISWCAERQMQEIQPGIMRVSDAGALLRIAVHIATVAADVLEIDRGVREGDPERLDEIVELASRTPHGAELLGRFDVATTVARLRAQATGGAQ